MDWFDDLVDSASSAWDEVKETGQQYVTGIWDDKKESFLNPEETAQQTVAALPNAAPSSEAGTGAQNKTGFNWQAAGVIVGVAGILLKVMK